MQHLLKARKGVAAPFSNQQAVLLLLLHHPHFRSTLVFHPLSPLLGNNVLPRRPWDNDIACIPPPKINFLVPYAPLTDALWRTKTVHAHVEGWESNQRFRTRYTIFPEDGRKGKTQVGRLEEVKRSGDEAVRTASVGLVHFGFVLLIGGEVAQVAFLEDT
jgi:hypothetical protein